MSFFIFFGSFLHFASVDPVGILYDTYFVRGYFSDDTDSKSWTWEWLTEYEIIWKAKLKTCFTNLILEEVAKRLDDFFEIYIIWKPSYIVVRFDDC